MSYSPRDYANEVGYHFRVMNGERVLGPPKRWSRGYPVRGSELYISRLTQNITEEKILPIFSVVGDVYQLRFKINFSGKCRGFAYITFANPKEAAKAAHLLNGYCIDSECKISVAISIDNRRLQVAKIALDVDTTDVANYFKGLVTGIVAIQILENSERCKNHRSAILVFEDHKYASLARRILIPMGAIGKFEVWWAEPEENFGAPGPENYSLLEMPNAHLMGWSKPEQRLVRNVFLAPNCPELYWPATFDPDIVFLQGKFDELRF